MTTTSALIRDLLRPGLNSILGDYPDLPLETTQIFQRNTSNMAWEKDISLRMLGLAQIRAEGASTEFQDIGEGPAAVYRHVVYSTGFVMTKIAIDDNLYEAQYPSASRALKSSMSQTKEIVGMAVLNNATTNTGPDGVPLLSTAHPIYNGTFSNTPVVPTMLSEQALQDSITRIARFKDNAGLRRRFKPVKLIVSPEMEFIAERLLGQQARVGTADNDRSSVFGRFPGGYMVSHFLTNTNAWFVITDVPDGLKYYQRSPLATQVWTDEVTDNVLTKATERYSFGYSDPRCVDGSVV